MRSPIPSNQTTIASHHPTPDRLNLKSNSDRPLITRKPDRLFPQIKTAIAPSTPTKPDRLFPHQTAIAPFITHKA